MQAFSDIALDDHWAARRGMKGYVGVWLQQCMADVHAGSPSLYSGPPGSVPLMHIEHDAGMCRPCGKSSTVNLVCCAIIALIYNSSRNIRQVDVAKAKLLHSLPTQLPELS